MVVTIVAAKIKGYILRKRFLKYFFKDWFLSKEAKIKKPLIVKKIGTPGNGRIQARKACHQLPGLNILR
jgi:hypothetical protein